MIVKLNGADFSNNNIGKIVLNNSVSDDTTVSEETNLLLSNYSKSFTDTQKLAVQNFIKNLKQNNLWASIENLYIPALANTVDETLFNIKTNTKDATPSSDYYLLQNSGLRTNYYSSDTVIPTNKRAIVKFNASYMNLHFMVYITEQTKKDDFDAASEWKACEYISSWGTSSESRYKGLKTIYNSGNGTWNSIITGATNETAISRTCDSIKGFVGVSCASDGLAIGIVDRSNEGQYTSSETVDTTFTNSNTNIGCDINGNAKCSNPMRIISMGTAMTKEQLLKYNELCDILISKICA